MLPACRNNDIVVHFHYSPHLSRKFGGSILLHLVIHETAQLNNPSQGRHVYLRSLDVLVPVEASFHFSGNGLVIDILACAFPVLSDCATCSEGHWNSRQGSEGN